jgi:hypothetical protein
MYLQLHGEVQEDKPVDGWIREYFPEMSYQGTFVDIGAYEPINISNSYHFEMNGWTVWCVEGNPTASQLFVNIARTSSIMRWSNRKLVKSTSM